MNRKEQLEYLSILGLTADEVTNKKEIDMAQEELDKESARRGMHIPPEVRERLTTGVYEVTELQKVKKAYKKKAMKHHPDKGGDAEMFKQVHHAYKMLTDPSFVMTEIKNKSKGQVNLDAVFNIVFTFDQAFFGDDITLTFNPIHLDESGNPVTINKGKDVHLEGRVFKIRIPEGTENGAQQRIPKEGLIQGERVGDFVINFRIENHHKFQLSNGDIQSQEQVPLELMLTGGEMEVATMWGIMTLEVPPGTKPNDILVIPKGGVSKVGHHCVTVEPLYPEKEDLKKKSIWQKLGIKWGKYESESEENFDAIYEELLKAGAQSLASEKASSSTRNTGL